MPRLMPLLIYNIKPRIKFSIPKVARWWQSWAKKVNVRRVHRRTGELVAATFGVISFITKLTSALGAATSPSTTHKLASIPVWLIMILSECLDAKTAYNKRRILGPWIKHQEVKSPASAGVTKENWNNFMYFEKKKFFHAYYIDIPSIFISLIVAIIVAFDSTSSSSSSSSGSGSAAAKSN